MAYHRHHAYLMLSVNYEGDCGGGGVGSDVAQYQYPVV